MKTWITSDFHLGDDRMEILGRPFGNKDGGGFGRRRSSEKSSGGRRSENNSKNRSSSRRDVDRPDRNSNNDRKPSGFGRKRRERR